MPAGHGRLSAELFAAGGFGAEIDLDRVNVAVDGMPPEVIAIGETQERLFWMFRPRSRPRLLRIYNEEFSLPQIARGARASVIGSMTGDQRYVRAITANVVMDVPIEFLTGSIKRRSALC